MARHKKQLVLHRFDLAPLPVLAQLRDDCYGSRTIWASSYSRKRHLYLRRCCRVYDLVGLEERVRLWKSQKFIYAPMTKAVLF